MKEWNGARWWKFDFHTHTPASKDYGKGPDQEQLGQRTPREWLLDYMAAEVDCVAVTDHNTGAWIDKLKQELENLKGEGPEGFRELHLFPGMEISVHGGIHILAIFDPSKKTSDLDALRGSVEYRGTPGTSDDVTRKSLVDVVGEIVSAGGIAVPAHVDKASGLFKQTGTTLEQALECDQIFAMELVSPTANKPPPYIDKNTNWTEVLGSDSHHPSGEPGHGYPGSYFTWIKMGIPSIEGLRLALLDGELSARRSDKESGNPNEHATSILESIEVSQARYMGRSKAFCLRLNPWLNAIIGGRGTGKSTSVEFLRTALRRQDELPIELKSEFEKYNQVYSTRENPGLLTDDAEIKVIYRKNDSRFRIQWSPSGDLEPIEEEIHEEWRPAQGDIRQRFPVRIYSQKQIFQLARSPLALLRIVDEAPDVDYSSWDEKWKSEEARFLSIRARTREIETGLSEEQRLNGELDDVKHKLAIFEKAGHKEVLKSFQNRSRQQRTVEAWEEGWFDAGNQLREVAIEIVPDLPEKTNFDTDSEEDIELHRLAARAHAHLDKIGQAVKELAKKADEAVKEWRQARDKSTWRLRVDEAAVAYQELKERLSIEDAGDPAAYGDLVQRRQSIEQRLRELDQRKERVGELNRQADASLRRLGEIRRELTKKRREFLRRVLSQNPYVKIEITEYGAKENAEEEFRRLLQREDGRFERDIGQLLGELYGNSNSDNVEAIENNLAKIKSNIRKIKSDRSDAVAVKDQRFIAHIQGLPPEAMDRLDLWFPEDSLDVQYSTTVDGRSFRSIQEGSPGQKTAALLAFLLSYGDEPLILDQPEDDLDNHLVYNLIVAQLREVKRQRQVIVITHNANIVVNGDAELVIALDVKHGETREERKGSLQEKHVRDTICAIMEGGREAFEERYRRIALEVHRV